MRFNKKLVSIILVISLIIFSSYLFLADIPTDNWIIEGDKVYVNDSNVHISVTPHTLTSDSDFIILNFTSKQFTGDIDVAFGFDTTQLRPLKAYYYSPHIYNRTRKFVCDFDDSYFNYTVSPKHFWCYRNSSNETLTLVYEHDFEWGDVENKIAYWNESESRNYKDVTNKFDNIDYDYGGMNKWHYIKDFTVIANQEYQLKIYFDVVDSGFGNIDLDTKYWVAMKPSSQTFAQAVLNENFYVLDPWLNSTGDDQSLDYLNDSLLLMYPFEDWTGTGTVIIDTTDEITVNATLTGATDTFNDTAGIIGASYCGANNVFLNTTISSADMGTDTTNGFFISFWFNTTSFTGDANLHFFGNRQADVDGVLNCQYNGPGGAINCNVRENGANAVVMVESATEHTWNHIIVGANATHLFSYYNGVFESANIRAYTNWPETGYDFLIFKPYAVATTEMLNTCLDNFIISNMTLNQSIATDLYNSGLSTYFNKTVATAEASDETVPNVTINSPTNTTYTTNSITFNVTAVDETLIDSCWYSLDSTTNVSLTNASSYFTNTNSSMTQGNHDVVFSCNDSSNNVNETHTTNFFIDSISPVVSIETPSNNTNHTTTNVNINYSIVETNLDSCWYTNDSGTTNNTIASCNNLTSLNWIQGNNLVTIYVNDTLNNQGEASINFFVDSISPVVSIETPSNNTNHTTTNVNINYSIVETNLDSCWYTNDSGTTNNTIASCNNLTSLNWIQGNNLVTIYVNDTLNNQGEASINFFVDSILPNLTINTPINQTYNTNTIVFNVSSEDSNNISSCWYSLDNGVTNITLNSSTGDYVDTNSSMLEGSYTTNYYCNDTYNNVNNSESVSFRVLTKVPIFITNPTTTDDENTLPITIVGNTSSVFSTCKYQLDTNSFVTIGTATTFNSDITSLDDGYHDLNITCNSSGVTNSTTLEFYAYIHDVGDASGGGSTGTTTTTIIEDEEEEVTITIIQPENETIIESVQRISEDAFPEKIGKVSTPWYLWAGLVFLMAMTVVVVLIIYAYNKT